MNSGPTKYLAIAAASFLAGLVSMYTVLRGSAETTLPPGVVSVPTYTITATVQAQDKPALRKAGAISKAVEKAPEKEVLQTGAVEDDSGSRTVAAVLDTGTGHTVLVEHRPWAELMSRHELGLGYGLADGDLARSVQYRWTFARLWDLYATAQGEARQIDRLTDRTSWSAMLYATARW